MREISIKRLEQFIKATFEWNDWRDEYMHKDGNIKMNFGPLVEKKAKLDYMRYKAITVLRHLVCEDPVHIIMNDLDYKQISQLIGIKE